MTPPHSFILCASGGQKLPHACPRHPETPTLGERCPELSACLRSLAPLPPVALVRFHLTISGHVALPFASADFQRVHLTPAAAVREDAMPLFGLVHPDDIGRVSDSMVAAARGITPWLGEYRILHPETGETRWLHTCLAPFHAPGEQGGALCGYGLITDVTARRQTRGDLVELCEHAPIGVFRTTPNGRILSANQHVARLCGYDAPEQLIAGCHDISAQLYMQPEERQSLLRILSAHGSVQRYALETRTRGGSNRWLSLNLRAVHNPDGSMACCEGYCADITRELDDELAHGRVQELERTRFDARGGAKEETEHGADAWAGAPPPDDAKEPAGTAPDGLCHLLAYTRDTLLWLLRLPCLH
ncbi:MAG: hypothetical protein AUJ49_10700 [Desulfovibrionaceae bacterium CG1_02_65_16]|nr:MAG: hypothetical protein AUJ49_10700 [Desulfovibrionaceae bacterium CG1_02_65_16]